MIFFFFLLSPVTKKIIICFILGISSSPYYSLTLQQTLWLLVVVVFTINSYVKMMREGNITGTKLTVLERRYKPLTVKESEFPRQLAFLRWGCFKGVTVFGNTEHIIKSKLWHENLQCGEILLKPAAPPTLLLSLVVEKSVLTWKNILYRVQLHAAQAGKQLPSSIMPQAVDMVPV